MTRGKWTLVSAVAGLLIVGGLVTFFIYPFVGMFFWVDRSGKEIRKMEAQLQMPEVYEPVAKRLALYCQSDEGFFPQILSGAWFPSELQKIGQGDGEVSRNHASIEMGGGFYHFGYRLELDESASVDRTNIWKLLSYSEGSDSRLLTRFALPASEHLAKEELHKMVEAGYELQISSHPGAYGGKVMTLLRFGKTDEAAGACKEWAKIQPNHWLPRFTLAHLRCRLGENDAASAEFGEWVLAHQNFAHCIYLALFNYREGNTNNALKAVRLALDQPFVEPPQTSGNKFYLGHNGAMIAYLSGDYGLCLATCDKMLADRDGSWKQIVSRLRSDAIEMKGGNATAAAQTKLVAAKPGTESWDWFTPYDTDEAGWHGSGDIPSPFPKNWRSGKPSSN